MTPLTRIQGYAHVAERYGLEEAIFMDAIVHWYRVNRADNKNFYDGRWWTYNTVKAFDQTFPWWSTKQIRRIITSCKDKGALLTCTHNKDSRDRTIWYSPSDEVLALYMVDFLGNCICPNGQMEMPKRADTIAQMGEALPCNNHVGTHDIPPKSPKGDAIGPGVKPQGSDLPLSDFPTTVVLTQGALSDENKEDCGISPLSENPTAVKRKPRSRASKKEPDWKPERFAKFWEYYPRGEAKQAAIRAWDKLQPSDELIDTMAQALKRQVASESWQQGIGIPYASTWLNQRRWTDEAKKPPTGQAQPGHVVEEEGTYLL